MYVLRRWVFCRQSSLLSITTQLMTKLNIRKNIASVLINTAAAVENAKFTGIGEKLNEYRIRTAALIMPSNMAFVITPKENIK